MELEYSHRQYSAVFHSKPNHHSEMAVLNNWCKVLDVLNVVQLILDKPEVLSLSAGWKGII